MTPRLRPRALRTGAIVCVAGAIAACGGPVEVAVDRTARFQTIQGWSATVDVGDSDWPQERVRRHRQELLDWVIDSVGVNRLRIEVRSGLESPRDSAPAFFADNSRRRAWTRNWYKIENDNDDPMVAEPGGFQFFLLDHWMETVVLPVRERLEAKGQRLYLNMNYVDFGRSPFEHRDHPEEFGEFLLVMFEHLDRKYGVIPDGVEILEPDNEATWSALDVARGFVAAGRRLEAAGYRPEFIGPSTMTADRAVEYLDEMMTVPGLERYLAELAYHNYGNASRARLREVAEAGERWNLRTAMLEDMYATHEDLYQDLAYANVSAWQRYSIMDYVRPDSAGGVSYRDDVKLMTEYFRSIDRGAVRIGATSSHDDVGPVAFESPDGSTVLVVRARRGRELRLTGLPHGSGEARFTGWEDRQTRRVTLGTDRSGALTASLPGRGVLVVSVG